MPEKGPFLGWEIDVMKTRWLYVGGLLIALSLVGCYSLGTMVGEGQMAVVTTQLNDSHATVAKDQGQIVSFTNQLNSEQPILDRYQILHIEVAFHQALATKDLDLMMSIFTDNAVMTTPTGVVYTGKAEIRTFYATKSVAMQPQNHWAALVPAYKIKVSLNGNAGQLTFECHLVDIATTQMKLEHQIDMTVVRQGSTWLVSTMKSTAIKLT